MKYARFRFLTGMLIAVLGLGVETSSAQTDIPFNAAEGSFSDPANWDHPFAGAVPEGNLDERAVVGNGGLAFVDDEPMSPGAVVINGGSTVEIRSGGSLTVISGGLVAGNVAVNNGTLASMSGGTLAAESLSSGASGNIILSSDTTFSVAGSSALGGTLTAEIDGPSFTPIDVMENATLGGILDLNFNGVSPSVGDTWDLIDAQTIGGSFANVTSNVSAGPGLVFGTQIVSGGNGQIAQATLEPRLTLQVNRRSGEVELLNLAGVSETSIDGYFISSPSGSFDPGSWNQFGAEGWIPSDAGATHVGELTLSGQRDIAATDSIGLGSFFANPARDAEFNSNVEDISFEYSLKSGEVLTGLVDYTDAHNSLVLVVDPESGETWMQNQSQFEISLDGYEIESVGESLNPAEWTSFASGNQAWTEANPANYHIGELSLGDSMTLEGEGEPILLGNLFTPGGEQDLLFRFNTSVGVEGGPAETFLGIVEYNEGPIEFGDDPQGIAGDYNNSGQVEQGDLDLVLLNWGSSIADPDSIGWTNDQPEGAVDQGELDGVLLNWGNTAAVGLNAASVPEPAGGILALVTAALLAVGIRKSSGDR